MKFKINDDVIVEFPEFNHVWLGRVIGFHNGFVCVIDQDDDAFVIEEEYLTPNDEA